MYLSVAQSIGGLLQSLAVVAHVLVSVASHNSTTTMVSRTEAVRGCCANVFTVGSHSRQLSEIRRRGDPNAHMVGRRTASGIRCAVHRFADNERCVSDEIILCRQRISSKRRTRLDDDEQQSRARETRIIIITLLLLLLL